MLGVAARGYFITSVEITEKNIAVLPREEGETPRGVLVLGGHHRDNRE